MITHLISALLLFGSVSVWAAEGLFLTFCLGRVKIVLVRWFSIMLFMELPTPPELFLVYRRLGHAFTARLAQSDRASDSYDAQSVRVNLKAASSTLAVGYRECFCPVSDREHWGSKMSRSRDVLTF